MKNKSFLVVLTLMAVLVIVNFILVDQPAAKIKAYTQCIGLIDEIGRADRSIVAYNTKATAIRKKYGQSPQKQWAPEDRIEYRLWLSDIATTIKTRNSLALNYNQLMSRFKFDDIKNVPGHFSHSLPRRLE